MTSEIKKINWDAVKVISFDLDDTLWDNTGVIEKCQQELFNFLSEQHPPIKQHFTLDSMDRIAEQFTAEVCPSFENMTVLRKAVIRQMLLETDGDLGLLNPAFSIFYFWRNQVTIPQVSIDLLTKLAQKYALFATSNGNSNLSKIGLRDYFAGHFIAGIHGRAKPSPEMLNKICQLKNIEPQQLLHIGDSYQTDIQSSIAANCQHLELDISRIEELTIAI